VLLTDTEDRCSHTKLSCPRFLGLPELYGSATAASVRGATRPSVPPAMAARIYPHI
jgi:hypothetical protein